MLVIEPSNEQIPLLTRWANINWTSVEATVRHLQGRIYRATAKGEWKKVKNLQKLVIRSLSAKLKAIRQVTQENSGKLTPGIDGVVCDTPEKRLELLKEMHWHGYHPKPVRRVYIPKAKGKQRPLGIPMLVSYCTSVQAGLGLIEKGQRPLTLVKYSVIWLITWVAGFPLPARFA